MIFHRKSKHVVPAHFHSHPFLEIGWTIVPAIILVLLAIPATKVLLNMNNNDQEELTVKVTGYQWKWHYEYLEDGVSFFSNLSTPVAQMQNLAPKGENYLREVDNPLVLPIHKKIRFLITSNDVNHAWWVPDFAIKRDAIAGFINEAWTIIDKPGTYRGQCAELCGINHAFMPIVVVATTEQGYKDFIAKQKGQATQGEAEVNKAWTLQELMSQGEKVYGRICAACHQPAGTGLPPTFPALKGSKVTVGPVEKHIETVMNGVSGTAMQAFKSQLNDTELAAAITYERNAFGNATGTIIQPIHIKALRAGKPMSEALATKPSGVVAPQAKTAAQSTVQPTPGATPTPLPAPATPTPVTSPAQTVPQASSTSVQQAPAIGTVSGVQSQTSPMSGSTSITITPPINETTTVTVTMTPVSPGHKPTSAPALPTMAPPASPTEAMPASQPTVYSPTPAAAAKPASAAPEAAPAVPLSPSAAVATPAPTSAKAQLAPGPDDLKVAMGRGEKIYLIRCAMCHQPQGGGMPPTFPALKGAPTVTGPVTAHISMVMHGKLGTAMQPFQDQLNDQEIADVITYERNAFGNHTGTLVRPDDIKAARQQAQTK